MDCVVAVDVPLTPAVLANLKSHVSSSMLVYEDTCIVSILIYEDKCFVIYHPSIIAYED